jgi:chaperonin GroEL
VNGQPSGGAPGHAFISYVHEDHERVNRLQTALERAGIRVWRDTANLWPGHDWKIEIRNAITGGSLAFIACFSENTAARVTSYQNEELILAVQQMRLRPPGHAWLIPVRFAECATPAFELGPGRTLDSLQRIDLFDGSWELGIPRLVGAVLSILHPPEASPSPGPTALAGATGGPEGSPSSGPPLQTADRVTRGISGVTELISRTLGPMGRTCVVRDQSGSEIEAPDARTIVQHFIPEDPRDVLGASYLRAMVGEQHHAAHDGAATAAVLAHAMVARTMEALHGGANPMSLKQGINAAVERVNEELSRLASDVEFKEQIASVAATSAGDPAIGEMIAEAMEKVGAAGVITVKKGSTFGLQLELTEGMHFDQGYISPHFVTDPKRAEAVLEDPYILVTNATISARKDLQPLLDKVVQSGHPLAIIAGDIEGEALALLVANKIRGLSNSVAVKAPGSGEHRKAMLGDIAILTGAAVIGEEVGIKLESAGLDLLGRARRVVATEDETAIVDGTGDADQIYGRVNQIRAKLKEIANTGSDDERERLRERLCRLAGGMAVIKVGAATEAELIRRKQRTESAVLISREAVEAGLLPGGGAALVDVQRRLAIPGRLPGGTTPPTADEATGTAIVVDSLAEPLKQIVTNAGRDPVALAGSTTSRKPGTGFDVVAGAPRDMLKAGIIDTVTVVSQAVANAANLAQRLLLLG